MTQSEHEIMIEIGTCAERRALNRFLVERPQERIQSDWGDLPAPDRVKRIAAELLGAAIEMGWAP